MPARYRGELLRLMATFVDSELAASAGFADTINDAPGITARIAACRITLEKADHAERVLDLMGDFGADEGRYAVHHPWADRLPRDAALGQARHGGDMRLAVFHYPIEGWTDAVVHERPAGPRRRRHARGDGDASPTPPSPTSSAPSPRARSATPSSASPASPTIAATEEGRAAAQGRHRLLAAQGRRQLRHANSARFETLKRFGLRHRPNEALLADWTASGPGDAGAPRPRLRTAP